MRAAPRVCTRGLTRGGLGLAGTWTAQVNPPRPNFLFIIYSIYINKRENKEKLL